MVITKTEAAAALSEIQRTTDRSHVLKGYRQSGPVFILWGVIWVVGYAAMGVLPPAQWGWVWLPLDVLGMLATFVLIGRGCGPAEKGDGLKVLTTILAIAAFACGILLLFEARSNNTYLAFPALLAGAIYFAVGRLGRAPRMMLIGALMFAATLIGFHFFAPWLAFWLAAVGGGGLIAGGLWLWRA
jgi:hypothetical protein